MVFSSLEFIYLFLPATFAGYLVLRRLGSETGIILWLIGASLVFYANWSVPFLALLLGSVGVNYGLHRYLAAHKDRRVLIGGIAANLATIGYFKYALFFTDNLNLILGSAFDPGDIVLPLGISFFTFQQIAFLVETYRGEDAKGGFLRYVLFVVFFPQLIAGPIVMQKETVPQFTLGRFTAALPLNVSLGLTLFLIGLFKKIVIADGIAQYATPIFELADAGEAIPLEMAWTAALGYTFQIYFDFSGYTDMALGLARLFGIRLPVNFNSPYKATSIVDFWRRWHITLSHFLRDYIYIPLGGNRSGKARRYANLSITMLLGGLWHGASWNFVLWGALHGFYLMLNHAFSALFPRLSKDRSLLSVWTGRIVTTLAVIVAWVFFRAESFDGAVTILAGMAGMAGDLPALATDRLGNASLAEWRDHCGAGLSLSILLFGFVWALPNSIELTRRYRPALHARVSKLRGWQGRLTWRPTAAWAIGMACFGTIALIQLYRTGVLSEFIYYNF